MATLSYEEELRLEALNRIASQIGGQIAEPLEDERRSLLQKKIGIPSAPPLPFPGFRLGGGDKMTLPIETPTEVPPVPPPRLSEEDQIVPSSLSPSSSPMAASMSPSPGFSSQKPGFNLPLDRGMLLKAILGTVGAGFLGGRKFRAGVGRGIQSLGENLVRTRLMGEQEEKQKSQAQQTRALMLARLGIPATGDPGLDEAIRQAQTRKDMLKPETALEKATRELREEELKRIRQGLPSRPGQPPKPEAALERATRELREEELRRIKEGLPPRPGQPKEPRQIPAGIKTRLASYKAVTGGLNNLLTMLKDPNVQSGLGVIGGSKTGLADFFTGGEALSPEMKKFRTALADLTGQLTVARYGARSSDAEQRIQRQIMGTIFTGPNAIKTNLETVLEGTQREWDALKDQAGVSVSVTPSDRIEDIDDELRAIDEELQLEVEENE